MTESQPVNRVRRRERAAEEESWKRSFLREIQFGSVASVSDGQPFINPVVFVYDEEAHAVYFHTGREGRIFANLTANSRVCFNASRMLGLESATSAAGFDVAYESVTIFGQAQLIEDQAEATRALQLLLARYFPQLRYGEDYTPATPEQVARTAVWRLAIDAWSGKRNPNPEAAAE